MVSRCTTINLIDYVV